MIRLPVPTLFFFLQSGVPPMKVVTPGASRLKATQGQAGSPDKGKHGKQRAEYMRIQAQQQVGRACAGRVLRRQDLAHPTPPPTLWGHPAWSPPRPLRPLLHSLFSPLCLPFSLATGLGMSPGLWMDSCHCAVPHSPQQRRHTPSPHPEPPTPSVYFSA